MSGSILGVTSWGRCYWVEAKILLTSPNAQDSPTAKNDLAPSVGSAEEKKRCRDKGLVASWNWKDPFVI